MPKSATPRPSGWVAPPLEEPNEGDLIVTHSEIEAYRQCPLKWMLGYQQRWTLQDREDDHPLTKGILWHDLMEQHYLTLQRMGPTKEALAVSEGIARAMLWNGPDQTPLQALVWWMYQGHIAKYGADPQWEILAVEVKFQARLYDAKGKPTRYLVKGKLDLVVRDRKTMKIWIVDHKSGANLPDQMELDVADQFGVYAWLLKRAGITVIGVIHSGNRTHQNLGDMAENQDAEGNPLKASQKKQTLDQRLRRTLLSRGAKELEAIARDFLAVVVNAYPEYSGLQALPVYSSPDPRSCSWKCDFLEAHLMARKGRPIVTALKELGFEQHFEERY